MGAFGVYVFDEDMACDALAGALHLENPLDEFLKQFRASIETDYLEIDDCGYTLAYTILLLGLKDIQIINKMDDAGLGSPYRENVLRFIENNRADWLHVVNKGLYYDAAKAAIDAVLSEKSESRELWADTDSLQDWINVVNGLKSEL